MPGWWSTPNAVEALPCGSRSTTSTESPPRARAAARLTALVVLPTPPFWLATTKIRVAGGGGKAVARRVFHVKRAAARLGAAGGAISSSSKRARRGPGGRMTGESATVNAAGDPEALGRLTNSLDWLNGPVTARLGARSGQSTVSRGTSGQPIAGSGVTSRGQPRPQVTSSTTTGPSTTGPAAIRTCLHLYATTVSSRYQRGQTHPGKQRARRNLIDGRSSAVRPGPGGAPQRWRLQRRDGPAR